MATVATIRCSDAFEFLSTLPENSVDLFVTSPPYFMGKEYDRSTSLADFVEEHERIRPLLLKALRKGGSICWQVGYHVKDGVSVPLDALVYPAFAGNGDLVLRNRIIWTFGHGTHAKRRFSGRHETLLWFTRPGEYWFDLDAVRIAQKYPGKTHYKGPNKGALSGNPLGKNPGDVWSIPNVKAGHVEKTEHPCQFPVALVRRMVRALTVPAATVVDPFVGSGSSAVAAVLEGRNFFGCDRERRYVRIAERRIRSLTEGTLRVRDDSPVYEPTGRERVARRPPHFAKGDS